MSSIVCVLVVLKQRRKYVHKFIYELKLILDLIFQLMENSVKQTLFRRKSVLQFDFPS